MKILEVNENACIGCGSCVAIDPEHFDFNDSGLSTVVSNENLESTAVVNAIESCPTNAISISGEIECDCHEGCECGGNCHCTSEENCSLDCSCEN